MVEWLLQDEHYVPQTDKDTFINKSILGFLRIVARIRTQGGHHAKSYQVNASIKVASTFLLILLLSLSGNPAFVVVVIVYILALLSLLRANEIIAILRVGLIVTLFTGIVLLPAILEGYESTSIMIIAKVFATVTAVNILSRTTRWHDITRALKRFFVPDIFILVLDIAIKYIVMLGDYTLHILYSLKLRSVGRNNRKYSSISGIAGTMFIKSREMSEEMYAAMECRGFTGAYTKYSRFGFSFVDFVYMIINVGLLCIFVYMGRK